MISAKVIADSISEAGKRITTFELEYPRFIHSEFMTHRQFSRNAASSRAIPVEKMIDNIIENPAMPIHWGANQPGMQAGEELDSKVCIRDWDGGIVDLSPQDAWKLSMEDAIGVSESFAEAGYHKQIVNRILEPFQHIKVVCTATEYDNFFTLRAHKDAQPEIQELAFKMLDALGGSEPNELSVGDWHLPYVNDGCWMASWSEYGGPEDSLSLSDARKLSASLCAQVSYRASDTSLEKALDIYDKLVTMRPVHASPFEHQATPMTYPEASYSYEYGTNYGDALRDDGTTHVDVEGDAWSGNFKGWIQNRQLVEDVL